MYAAVPPTLNLNPPPALAPIATTECKNSTKPIHFQYRPPGGALTLIANRTLSGDWDLGILWDLGFGVWGFRLNQMQNQLKTGTFLAPTPGGSPHSHSC